MTEISPERIALRIAEKARLLALEAETYFVTSSDAGVSRLAMERMEDSEHGISFWIEQLKKVAAK